MHKENTMNEGKSNKYKNWMWVFVFVSIIFAGIAIYATVKFTKLQKQIAQIETTDEATDEEKENLIRYLNNIENTYAELIYEYEGLDSLLSVEKTTVNLLKKEITQVKGSSEEYRLKVEELKERLEDYQVQIISLKSRNEALTAENIKVKTELNEVKSEKITLEKKVEKGAALKAYEILAYGIRSKTSGEELPTQLSKMTNKIKTCFILSENTLTAKGNKMIYVRIFGPDGKILSNSPETFEFEGKQISYSIKKQIFYDNAAMDICLYWEMKMSYIKGDYTVVIFADAQIIGSTYFTLE